MRRILKDKLAAYAAKGQATRPLRVMVLGIPNVGKSTFINKVAGKKAAAVSDRPGVTRGRQWISVDRGLELLDTPGILWPRFDSQEVGELLAVTGAVKDDVLDRETLAANLLIRLRKLYPEAVNARYKLTDEDGETGWQLFEAAAKKRGFLAGRGEYDTERMSAVLLDEFRGGKLGRMTLEAPMKAEIDLWELENELYDSGKSTLCGVDEAGRGPLAGPVCAAAVMLPRGIVIDGLNDSKKLSKSAVNSSTAR